MERQMVHLVKRACTGDSQAFTQLILDREQMLSRVAMAMLKNAEDAADAVQEAVLDAWQGLPRLREPSYFNTWLVKILIRSCYRISADRTKRAHSQLEEFLAAQEPLDWDQSLDIRATLEQLKPEDCLLLGLFYYDGLSVREIAQAMELSEDCVKQRLHRSRKRFRLIFLEKEAFPHDR